MALDRLGGIEITLVYCTLCGTAIPYKSVVGGQHRTFGTSGLIYRANKLMFDHESNSLWSTLLGTPVIGKLVGSGLKLESLPIVTTRWGNGGKNTPTPPSCPWIRGMSVTTGRVAPTRSTLRPIR